MDIRDPFALPQNAFFVARMYINTFAPSVKKNIAFKIIRITTKATRTIAMIAAIEIITAPQRELTEIDITLRMFVIYPVWLNER